MMRISPDGLAALKRMEGCRLKAFADAGGWSIGFGHYGCGPNDEITQERADELLLMDLDHIERSIEHQCTVPLTQGQFDALCCLAYNIGVGALQRSTLLRKLNAGDMAGAAQEFLRWDFVGEKKNPGLSARRREERELFLS